MAKLKIGDYIPNYLNGKLSYSHINSTEWSKRFCAPENMYKVVKVVEDIFYFIKSSPENSHTWILNVKEVDSLLKDPYKKFKEALEEGKTVQFNQGKYKGESIDRWISYNKFNGDESEYGMQTKFEFNFDISLYKIKNEHQDLIDATVENPNLQIQFFDGKVWKDLEIKDCLWIENVKYRIKPEPEYIPFDFSDAEQLIGKVIRRKDGEVIDSIIAVYKMSFLDPAGIKSGGHGAYSFDYLLRNFEFLDGSPCGKLKQD